MAQENHCPQCGANLPPDAPEGLCPKCLMKAVQENDVGATLEQSYQIEGPGTKIGRYELLSLIGEGGMGLVYQAEQKEPVKRRVALKIIKPGMDSKQVIARFEAERQIQTLPMCLTPGQPKQAGRTSLWNMSEACPSLGTVMNTGSMSNSG